MIRGDASPDSRPRPSAREIADFGEAVGALLVASLAIAVLPFRLLTRTIASPRGAEPALDRGRTVADVTTAVERAARRLPLRVVCLHQGLATHWMLHRRGIASRIHYGISPANALLKAHVWVDVDGVIIMGEEASLGFTRVATFPDAKGRANPLADG